MNKTNMNYVDWTFELELCCFLTPCEEIDPTVNNPKVEAKAQTRTQFLAGLKFNISH
jgi:hypothetical protein